MRRHPPRSVGVLRPVHLAARPSSRLREEQASTSTVRGLPAKAQSLRRKESLKLARTAGITWDSPLCPTMRPSTVQANTAVPCPCGVRCASGRTRHGHARCFSAYRWRSPGDLQCKRTGRRHSATGLAGVRSPAHAPPATCSLHRHRHTPGSREGAVSLSALGSQMDRS